MKSSALHGLSMLALVCSVGSSAAAPDQAASGTQSDLARGWSALRAMDCARCHGRDYGGLSAPSLIAAARDGTLERFRHFVLEGDPVRGMPGYRSQPLVVADVDAMYAYLQARGSRSLEPGKPVSGKPDADPPTGP
jgi:cytochrome c55X